MTQRLTLLFVSVLTLCACAPKPPGERFYGSWRVEATETLNLDPTVSALSPNARHRLQKVTSKWMSSIQFTFGRDGQLTVQFANAESRYTFTVGAIRANELELNLSGPAKRESQTMMLSYEPTGMKVVTAHQRWMLKRH